MAPCTSLGVLFEVSLGVVVALLASTAALYKMAWVPIHCKAEGSRSQGAGCGGSVAEAAGLAGGAHTLRLTEVAS